MYEHSGTTVSIWMSTHARQLFEPLATDETADVCIVGAGIAGLTTAYLLGREGKSVVVLDDGPIISGETERTTAHLSNALDDRFYELERMHGLQGARLAAESHGAAIEKIQQIVTREGIDCDLERLPGYLFVPPGESTEVLFRELEVTRRINMPGVELLPRAPMHSFDTGQVLMFPNQGQFHVLKYLSGLVEVIVRNGGRIYSHTHAESIEGGYPGKVKTSNGHTITAQSLVVATNTPINDRVTIHSKQAPYRTYAIAAGIEPSAIPRALYWDTADPYHYVRLQTIWDRVTGQSRELLIVGGEDHKTGQATDLEQRFAHLETWTRERFPIEDLEYRWSGQVMEPVDGLAFIGRNPRDEDNVYIATGDSGHGMTHGTIAGMLITDLIGGRDNPWASLYDPSRRSLQSIGEYARENLNVAARYGDYLSPGDSTGELAPESGVVIRRGLKKVAVYCDSSRQQHELSAVCPHLGCIVAWNSLEKSWDCPCHGSRFDCLGDVINGPANVNLSPVGHARETAEAKYREKS